MGLFGGGNSKSTTIQNDDRVGLEGGGVAIGAGADATFNQLDGGAFDFAGAALDRVLGIVEGARQSADKRAESSATLFADQVGKSSIGADQLTRTLLIAGALGVAAFIVPKVLK